MKKPKIIHIALDSNILRQDRGFSKSDMRYLAAFARLGLIKIHIPWFVYMECITHYIAEIDAELRKAMAGIMDLSKKGMYEDDELDLINIAAQIENKRVDTRASVEKVWKDFIKETGSQLHAFDPKHSVTAMGNYFAGEAPYSALKKRDDIPDAFILEGLKSIAASYPLHFISADKNLAKYASAVKDITVYHSIKVLTDSIAFKPALDYYDTVGKVKLLTMELVTLLPEIAETIAYQIPKWSQFNCYVDYPYSNDDSISVNAIDNPVVTFDNDNIRVIDEEFHIPFTITGTASIDFFVDNSDAWSADETDDLPPVSPWNDWVMLAEDVDEVTMKGTLKLPIAYATELSDIQFHPEDVEEFIFDAMKAKPHRSLFGGDL